MKTLAKKLLPKKLIGYIRNVKQWNHFKKVYRHDLEDFYGVYTSKDEDLIAERLIARIIYDSHAIEKGLTNINFRYGFGKRALSGLRESLIEYHKKGFSMNNFAVSMAIGTLHEYVRVHKNTAINTSDIIELITVLMADSKIAEFGGIEIKRNDSNYSDSSFENLITQRKSVRDFGKDSIDIDSILKAVSLASNTPSICNRQPWSVIYVDNKDIASAVLNEQKGLNNFGSDMSGLIIICSNLTSLLSLNERNEGFTNCGMFAMSLLLALENQNIAACALNASLSVISHDKIRDILHLSKSSKIVMFIAVGSFPTTYKVCKSNRKSVHEILKII